MKIVFKEIIGTPDNQGWVQIHHFSGVEKEKKEKRGQLLLLLSLKDASEEAATGYGREIISRTYEEYYGNLEGSPMNRLKEVLVKIGREQPIYLTERIGLSLQLAVFWQDLLYLGTWGPGQTFLLRAGKFLSLLSGEPKKASVLSGRMEKEDLLILGTDSFFNQIPQGTIKACLQNRDSLSAAEVLSPLVHARPDQSQMGAALVQVENSPKEESLTVKELETVLRIPRRKSPVLKLKAPLLSSKLKLALGTSLLCLFLAVLGFSFFRNKEVKKQKAYAGALVEIQSKLKTAQGLPLEEEKDKLNLAKEAQSLIDQAREYNFQDSSLDSLEKEAKELVIFSGGGEKIRPELFFKLSLLAEEAKGEQLVISDQELFVFDPGVQKVYRFEYLNKRSQTLSGGEILANAKKLTVESKNRFYLADDRGVVFWDGQAQSKRIVEREGSDYSFFSFWGNNFYILDKNKKELAKIVGLGQTYSSQQSWFAAEPSLDWEKIKDAAIDGSIWILLENGEVRKFFQGREVAFSLENNPLRPSSFLGLSESRLVVLNKENQILIWDKNGAWQGQVNLEINPVLDLVLSPNGEWLFLLTSGEVYDLNLNEALS